MSASHNEPSGIRMIRLIETKIHEITQQEAANNNKICLYSTGDYWMAFERSAFLLKRIFPNLKAFVINHPGFLVPVVGVSLPDEQLKAYGRKHTIARPETDYAEITASPFDKFLYGDWHNNEVRAFKN